MLPSHPIPARRTRTLVLLAAAANRLPADRAGAIVLAILAVSGAADLLIGHGATMSLFYATAIVFAAWRLGRAAGFATVGTVVVIALAANLYHGHWSLSAVTIWNLAVNASGAVLLVGLAATLRATIEHERARASIDPLTGALNRAAFFERLAGIGGKRERLLLACVDLDGFKAVNDERGHAAGDRLLADFAGGVDAALAEGEAIGRIGGDEFAMIVALAPGEDAAQRARRLHRHLGEVLAQGGHPVTCSVGAATIPGGRWEAGALLAAADAAMYEIKRAGRNGIRLVEARARAGEAPGSLRLVARDAS